MAIGQPKAPGLGWSMLERSACMSDGVQKSGDGRAGRRLLSLGVQGGGSGMMNANKLI